MKELERLIRKMREHLSPYRHRHDIESGVRRWRVTSEEVVASWIGQQLRLCREKNRCFRRERCVFFEYGDIANRNYRICNEVLLRLENGSIACRIEQNDDT